MSPAPSRHTTDPSRSVAIGNLDDLLVVVWADRPISEAIYKGYLTTRIGLVDRLPPFTAELVVSPSFSPNLRQRGLLKDAEAALRMEAQRTFVVVSDVAAVRNVAATMSWMFPKKWAIKAFPMIELPLAAAFVKSHGVRAQEPAILACVEQLRGLLVPPTPED